MFVADCKPSGEKLLPFAFSLHPFFSVWEIHPAMKVIDGDTKLASAM